jgi:hypothetical protein
MFSRYDKFRRVSFGLQGTFDNQAQFLGISPGVKEPASLAGTATILVLAVLAVCISPAADLPPTVARHSPTVAPVQITVMPARPNSARVQAADRGATTAASMKLVRVLLC